MAKFLLVSWLFISAFVHAATSPITTAGAFKQALGQLRPGDILPGFTENPPETNLSQLDRQGLERRGLQASSKNETASRVISQSRTRERAYLNPNSPEMQIAGHLIEGGDSVKEGGCYKAPPICHTNISTHTCEDSTQYEEKRCLERLTVVVLSKTHAVTRIVSGLVQEPYDLADCGRWTQNNFCTHENEVHVSPDCYAVSVRVTQDGRVIETSLNQTCTNLKFTLKTRLKGYFSKVDIVVTEYTAKDVLDTQSCQALKAQEDNGRCIFQFGEPCLEANVTKEINGFPIQRACWGKSMNYLCVSGTSSSCTSLINQGCAQTRSSCVEQQFGQCTSYSQTFECSEETCIPQPDICMPSLPCVDGSCDTTKNEESNDMGEGVSRLGALIGAASDVAKNQIDSGMAKIFAGDVVDCKSYPLGFRDCCTDSGWGDWVKQCPAHLQALQKAKDENRVVSLGKYKKHKLDLDEHHTFCVFPSKLGAIIQKEGRGAQLHISFGKAKHPVCRGITPEELEHINFEKLNLSPIEHDLVARLNQPDLGQSSAANQAHIERLNQAGRAHD